MARTLDGNEATMHSELQHGIDVLDLYENLPFLLALGTLFVGAALWLGYRRGRRAILLWLLAAIALTTGGAVANAYFVSSRLGVPTPAADIPLSIVYFAILATAAFGASAAFLWLRVRRPPKLGTLVVSSIGSLALAVLGYAIGTLVAVLLVIPRLVPR
jgi:hypothetical protein